MTPRKSQRRALVTGAGLAVAVIVSATALHQPAQHAETESDLAASSAATAGTKSTIDAAKPHFERPDEPAVEESVNSYGG